MRQTKFREKLSPIRLIFLLISIVVIGVCWWQVLRATAGLTVRYLEQDGVPLRFLAPQDAEEVPGVIIAHGFSGSQQLMLGYGITLARAGYGVVLLDFDGHGANTTPLDRSGQALAANLETAYAALVAQPVVDAARVALLGHSMGSGAVMTAGSEHGARYRATIAISPTDADVSPALPRNLMLQAGSLEAPFVANAEDLLARAGGPNPDLSADAGRVLVIVPNAEHISILFRWLSHNSAAAWLNGVFGEQRVSAYRDVRIVWYGVHLLAWVAALLVVSPWLPSFTNGGENGRSRFRRGLGLILGSAGGTAVLVLISSFIPLATLAGLAVGGALGLWFLIMGLLWLFVGFRPPPPTAKSIGWALAVFAFVWLAFGLLSQWVWLPWFLPSARLWRWLVLALAFLPFFLAAGLAQQGTGWGKRLGWWLAESVVVLAGLLALVVLVPDLFFLSLVVPLLPVILGFLLFVGKAIDNAWAYGLGSALFFAWLIAAVFPLVN